jgi:hypothetical protein
MTYMLPIVLALPWIAATLWIASRAGWSVLWTANEPSQAQQLPGFGANR